MKLPQGVTVAVLDDRGAEVVIRIEGSEKYVAETLACAGQVAMLALPTLAAGEEKRFDLIQGRDAS